MLRLDARAVLQVGDCASYAQRPMPATCAQQTMFVSVREHSLATLVESYVLAQRARIHVRIDQYSPALQSPRLALARLYDPLASHG
jgi:hypothetical protein